MTEAGGDLSRRALEGLALEEYKGGRIRGTYHRPRAPRLLGFGTRYELDGFLKAHCVYEDYTMWNFEMMNRREANALR
jgi:hypothetical protein